jgi:hypothetical protein
MINLIYGKDFCNDLCFDLSLVVLTKKNMSSKDFGSVDSTIVPTSSVQSVGTTVSALDSLSSAMDRFSFHSSGLAYTRIRRNILNLIRKSLYDSEERISVAPPLNKRTARGNGGNSPVSLLNVSSGARGRSGTGIPQANLLRPPRGSISFATKDLNREFLVLRRLPISERSLAAARLIRTLDSSLPTHTELALSLFLIATL